MDSDWFRATVEMLPVATTPLGPSGRGAESVWFFDNSVGDKSCIKR